MFGLTIKALKHVLEHSWVKSTINVGPNGIKDGNVVQLEIIGREGEEPFPGFTQQVIGWLDDGTISEVKDFCVVEAPINVHGSDGCVMITRKIVTLALADQGGSDKS